MGLELGPLFANPSTTGLSMSPMFGLPSLLLNVITGDVVAARLTGLETRLSGSGIDAGSVISLGGIASVLPAGVNLGPEMLVTDLWRV